MDSFRSNSVPSSAEGFRRHASICGGGRLSIEQWAPHCQIIYDKFHIMQHANKAVDEVRRTEFFRKGGHMRSVVRGKLWPLLSRWINLDTGQKQQLNKLFALNRRVLKAYLLKESLDRLWTYRYAGAMVRCLQNWMDQLRWQRLKPFEKLAQMLVDHLEGILNNCRIKVPMGVVEAVCSTRLFKYWLDRTWTRPGSSPSSFISRTARCDAA
jgi:transposase